MIIIPTEKRFDWKHAPITLFVIVLLNIFIYFIPQSSDNDVIVSAFVEYQQQNFLDIEWPFLKTYLKETEQDSTLTKLEDLYNDEAYEKVIGHILFDNNFYRYLRQDQYTYFQTNEVGDWFSIREQINTAVQSTFVVSFGLVPADISPLSLISYQFLHGSIMHLLGNLFFLIVCGFAVEAAIGHWRFLLFYLLSGICGGLLHAAFNSSTAMPLVGASGAISGTMAMYLGLFRLKKIEFFYWFFVFVGYFRAPALFILAFYIGKELIQLFSDAESNTAFLAHIGGFLCGGLLMGAAYKISPDIFNEEYIEEDQSIDPLQEKKATVYEFIEKYQFDAAEKAIARIIEQDKDNSDGVDFELALIRYNLEKIEKKNHFLKHLVELLLTQNPTEQQANKLETVWQENAEKLKQLNNGILIKIGFNLVEASSPKQAGLLFDHLYESSNISDNPKHQSALAVLANKLAKAYGYMNNNQQQQKFNSAKKTLLAGKPV